MLMRWRMSVRLMRFRDDYDDVDEAGVEGEDEDVDAAEPKV